MQKIDSRKLVLVMLSLLIMVVVALLIGRLTYAFMGPDIDEDKSNQGEVTASGDTLIFSKGNDISLVATTDNFGTGKGNLSRTTNPSVRLVANSKTNNANATYFVGVNISENTFQYTTSGKTPELILTVRDEAGNLVTSSKDNLPYVTTNGVSGFDITGKTGVFNIVADKPISTTSSTSGTTHTWTFTLTLINLTNDQSLNENASINFNAILQKDKLEITLANYIKGLYTTQGANNLYHHDGTLENGINDGSYRYAGKYEEVNNWVCFGYDDPTGNYANGWCPANNLYRIIGVFNEKVLNEDGTNSGKTEERVKLIMNDYPGESVLGKAQDETTIPPYSSFTGPSKPSSDQPGYAWSGSTSVSNNWLTSTFNTATLNGTYLTILGSEWTSKIALNEWKVGGNTYSNIYNVKAATTYQNEIVSPAQATTDKKKVGLMYASDYGFTASLSNWTTNLLSYGNDTNRNNNWLYRGVTEWTITPESSYSDSVFFVIYYGSLDSIHNYDANASGGGGTRPVFYLNSNVTYASGEGTSTSPYRIG